jgi:hypothetical protein
VPVVTARSALSAAFTLVTWISGTVPLLVVCLAAGRLP